MRVLVTGATSMIGDFLLPLLLQEGHEIVATSRRPHVAQQGIQWLIADLESDGWVERVGHVDLWVNLVSLNLLRPLLSEVFLQLKVKRLIVFSSTSKFTKINARGHADRKLAQELEAVERDVRSLCEQHQREWVIFRPTLIYCLGKDKNLTLITDKIQRFHFFPLVGSGAGLRQPVHAEDLAQACVQAAMSDRVANKAYNLSGGEVLSYRAMVVRLFELEKLHPRFIHIPLIMLRIVIQVFRLLPKYRYLSLDMADRMECDMVFSHELAAKDFSYAPRTFQP